MPTQLSASLSTTQLQNLDLNLDQALDQTLSFHFSHLRLASYWHKLEFTPHHYRFSQLTEILTRCQQAHQNVVLTLGVKAPRWPEYYWPDFIENKNFDSSATQQSILDYLAKMITKLKHFSCITHWQIENEPLNPSGPNNLVMPFSFLKTEVELVKSLDDRPIVMTVWGNDFHTQNSFSQIATIADVIGLDLYYQQFVCQILGKSVYLGPRQTDQALVAMIKSTHQPVWITELQAEPWEKDFTSYCADQTSSLNPKLLIKNLNRARQLPVDEIFLWGLEYWLWRSKQGDDRYCQLVRLQSQNDTLKIN